MDFKKLTLVLRVINLLEHEKKRIRLSAQITTDNLEKVFEEALNLFDKQEKNYCKNYTKTERLCV